MDRTTVDRYAALIVTALFTLGVVASPARSAPGELDVRFGTHGQMQVPGQIYSAAIVLPGMDRILVFGVPEDAAARDAGSIAIARLHANGEPDVTFGPAGHLDVPLGSEARPVPTDAILSGGGILVSGYFATKVSPPDEAPRSQALGWLVRVSEDGRIDRTFGMGGIARIGAGGIDRIAQLPDGENIVAAAPGLLHHLHWTGTPSTFPGSEQFAVPVASVRVLLPTPDGIVVSSGYWDGWDGFSTLSRFESTGQPASGWASRDVRKALLDIASLALDADGTRLLACGTGYRGSAEALLVQRLQRDGSIDSTFAPDNGGRVELGFETRPGFESWRSSRCDTILPTGAGSLVIGHWHRPYDYGGSRLVLELLNESGEVDPQFDPSALGRELALGVAGQWSSWSVLDAILAYDGDLLLLARRADDPHTFLARVQILPSRGAGSVGFTHTALRIAERRPAELRVHRSGGTSGAISVSYEIVLSDTATAADIAPMSGTLTWADGDASSRAITLAPIDDDAIEGEERFFVRLSAPTGGAALGAPEIEVTIEDDEALNVLQFEHAQIQVQEGKVAEVTIRRPAATTGPVVVRYAIAAGLHAYDGAPSPGFGRFTPDVGEIRWSGEDTSSRTLPIHTWGSSTVQPDETIYVALADVSGTLRDGNSWKAAQVIVTDAPARSQPPPPLDPPQRSGGGAVSLELLPLLALVVALRARRKDHGARLGTFSLGTSPLRRSSSSNAR